MDLRSRTTRSRSKTPFTGAGESMLESSVEMKGNHLESRVVRTTRRTTTTVNKNNDSSVTSTTSARSGSGYSFNNSKPATSSTHSSYRQHTSDYSSEEGEDGSPILSENEKNQLIEDARAAANGKAQISALGLYRQAGRYWEKYPKTDWTYSKHSRDRVELAPGVVQMPNMSRRTIHSFNSNYLHKETSTDDYGSDYDEVDYQRKSYSDNDTTYLSSFSPGRLFQSPDVDREYPYAQATNTYIHRFFIFVISRLLMLFMTLYSVATWPMRYGFQRQYSGLITFGKWIHRAASWVMLTDTWLLKKARDGDKVKKLLVLCALPLILLGGWWFFSNIAGLLFTAPDYTRISDYFAWSGDKVDTDENFRTYQHQHHRQHESSSVEKIIQEPEKIYVEPDMDKIVSSLKHDQLQRIAIMVGQLIDEQNSHRKQEDTVNNDEIVARILMSPSIQEVINNNYHLSRERREENEGKVDADIINEQQRSIRDLREEIGRIRMDVSMLEKSKVEDVTKLHNLYSENIRTTSRLSYQLNRCCNKNLINMQTYIVRTLTELLNNPEFLKNQRGFSDWLNSLFIARNDLESRLVNLTQHLNSRYDTLIEENGRIIMNEVTTKLKSLIPARGDLKFDDIPEEKVHKIVQNALRRYDADKTGLVDYAMEPMGGQIITTRCTESYHTGTAVVSILGLPLWYPSNSPRLVITPGLNPGECWAFQNFPGFLVIRLSSRIKIEAFSYEHISRLLAPDGVINSAPREFEVYGLTDENDKDGLLIGRYVYEYDGEPLQFFLADGESEGLSFETIELRVLSNHGNPNYTCLYRFRVHGKLSHD